MNSEVPWWVWVAVVASFMAIPLTIVMDLMTSQTDCYEAVMEDTEKNHALHNDDVLSEDTKSKCSTWGTKGQIYSKVLLGRD